jgi:hypothetical protein
MKIGFIAGIGNPGPDALSESLYPVQSDQSCASQSVHSLRSLSGVKLGASVSLAPELTHDGLSWKDHPRALL